MPHPGINDEDLALGNANFEIADLISVSVPKPCVEGVAVLWKKRADILQARSKISSEKLQHDLKRKPRSAR